jgi:hypothetical protein
MEWSLKKKLVAIGSVTTALASILGFVFLVFPRLKPTVITNKAVQFTDIRVRPLISQPGFPSDNCNSIVAVSFKVRIEGYQNMPLHADEKLDGSLATSAITNGIPCPPPLGIWDDWNHGKELMTTAQSQLLPVEIQVPIPLKKDNWKIQLRITDPRGNVLETGETQPFNTR